MMNGKVFSQKNKNSVINKMNALCLFANLFYAKLKIL